MRGSSRDGPERHPRAGRGATVATVDELTALLLDARGGSRRAFAAFVQQSQPEIWRLCVHLVGTGDADDATQETYVAAWRALPAFRGESTARTWLFVIARRSAERVARRRRRWLEVAGRAPVPLPVPGPEARSELGSLLAGLELDRRTALVLTQLLGLSYAEAAEVCGCPVGTIRSRVARARADLLDAGRDAPGAAGSDVPG